MGFNEALMNRLNESGALYLTHTRLDDRFVLRLAVGSPATRQEHIERAWALIVETAGTLSRRTAPRLSDTKARAAGHRRAKGSPQPERARP